MTKILKAGRESDRFLQAIPKFDPSGYCYPARKSINICRKFGFSRLLDLKKRLDKPEQLKNMEL
jgi:hypothetical protein